MAESPVPAGSPSRGRDVTVGVFGHKPAELAHSFCILLFASIPVFKALSTVFRSKNSPDNALLSHFVLPVLFLPYLSFQLYISF